VRGPAVGDSLSASLDQVLEAKARAAKVAAARVDRETVVEACRDAVAHGRLGHERLDPTRAKGGIAAREAVEVLDACDLEPDEVRGVVGDTLSVGLGETNADLGRESKLVQPEALSQAALLTTNERGIDAISHTCYIATVRYEEDRLVALERLVAELRGRVEQLESERALRAPTPERVREPETAPPRRVAPPPAERAEPEPAEPRPPRRPAQPRVPVELEDLLGGRVLAWVGGSAIFLGVVFFLVMAVRNGWIDEPTRVVLAFLGSTALLAAGVYLYERRGRTEAAIAAVASAIAALYASLTVATQVYELIAPALGLLVAALVGAAATAIAVRWHSPLVGALGIVGALVSPVLVEASTSTVTLLFMAIALVSATAVLLWQRWDWLAAAAFLVSVPQLLVWVDDTYRDQVGLALLVLAAFWAVEVVAAIGYELRVPTASLRASSALLLLANALLVSAVGYFTLHDLDRDASATAWVLGLAVVHVVLGAGSLRGRLSDEIGVLLIAVALGLSAVGLALALSGPALVAAWAVEAAVLAWVARRTGDSRAHLAVFVFLTLAAAHTLVFEAPLDSLRQGVDDLGRAAVALILVAAAALVAAWQYRGEPRDVRTVLEAVGAAALVYLPSVAIVDLTSTGEPLEPGQTPQVLLSAFWSVVGLAALVAGLLRDDRRLRLGGLVLLGIAVVKVFVFDLAALESIYRVLSFIALGLLLLVAAFAYQRIRLAARGDE
jgi:uncharacterized membrane protein